VEAVLADVTSDSCHSGNSNWATLLRIWCHDYWAV